MAVLSGTSAWLPVVDDLVTEAWERIGKSGSILTGQVARSAMRSLQFILLDWSNRGLNLWRVQQVNATMTANVATYTLAPGMVDLLDISLVTQPGLERNLAFISRTEYQNLTAKGTLGLPTQLWVERVQPAATLHFYPTPSSAYAFNFSAIVLPQDVTGLLQLADAPALWGEALASELAVRLAVKYAPDRIQVLQPLADRAYAAAAAENRERVTLTVMPDNWC